MFIYILGTNTSENRVKAFITRKVYIIDNFKAKILIGIDIMGLKSMNIFIAKKEIYIENYKISSPINIKIRGQSIQRAVYI